MKNKTITRGALWAAAAMAVLICIFVALQLRSDREAEASQEDGAYLAQLIAQYRARWSSTRSLMPAKTEA